VIGDLAADIDERKGDSGERDKYELLFKRDQEMTEFIDRFEETREKEVRRGARRLRVPSR
jgi:intraflagellar transport protein 74